jgi:membrane protease subunit (stomatin/prohibitin family)
MRGRGLMLVAGMKMGQAQAQQQAQAQANQQAAVEQARQEGAAQAQTAAAAPAAGGMDDATMAQLTKLADLHNSGVLSDEEFTAAKKKVLGM